MQRLAVRDKAALLLSCHRLEDARALLAKETVAVVGFGRMVALHYGSSTLYQTH